MMSKRIVLVCTAWLLALLAAVPFTAGAQSKVTVAT